MEGPLMGTMLGISSGRRHCVPAALPSALLPLHVQAPSGHSVRSAWRCHGQQGPGQGRWMRRQGCDVTDISEARFPKPSCSQPAWQCCWAGAEPAASMPALRRRRVPSSPTCISWVTAIQQARPEHRPPSLPLMQCPSAWRGTGVAAGEGECQGGGNRLLGHGEGCLTALGPVPSVPRYSCTLPNAQ